MTRFTSGSRVAASALLLAGFLAAPAFAEAIEPDAEAIIKGMADYMEALPAFSVGYDVNTDVMLRSGQKHKLSSSGSLTLRRPGEVRLTRKGELIDAEFIYDGKTISALGHRVNAYFQAENAGTIDTLIDSLRNEHGVEAPVADLVVSNVQDGLMGDVSSAAYYGTAWINGIECHHVGVRAAEIDWQIWVEADDTPLPCQYVITSKWMTGAPEHAIRFYGWNVAPEIADATFTFTPPEGATKLESMPADEIGALMHGE